MGRCLVLSQLEVSELTSVVLGGAFPPVLLVEAHNLLELIVIVNFYVDGVAEDQAGFRLLPCQLIRELIQFAEFALKLGLLEIVKALLGDYTLGLRAE